VNVNPTTIPVFDIPLDQIRPSPINPRKTFRNDDGLEESVAKKGVLQPVLARPLKNANGVTHELVFGARRFAAAKKAGLATIPAMVRELDDGEALELMLIENANRTDVHPLEEARALHELHVTHKRSLQHIAEKTGRTAQYVNDRLRLLNLTKRAQQIFVEDKITLGHAVVLSRLSPESQERALDPQERAVFEFEHTLFDPRNDSREPHHKPRSVKEFQAWVDTHVKLDAAAVEPLLFPETAQAVTAAKEEAEKVVQITYEFQTPPDARDGSKIYTLRAWKQADGRDGTKICDHAVTGVIVIGPGRGEALKVCVAKEKCSTHWSEEIRAKKERAKEAAKGATGEDRAEIERQQREAEEKKRQEEQARWMKAAPAIADAINAKITTLPAKATGVLADIVRGTVMYRDRVPCLPVGKSAEDLIRCLASFIVNRNVLDQWSGPREVPALAKKLGVDVAKLLDQAAPVEKPKAEAQPRRAPVKAAKRPAAKPAKKRSASKRKAK
jgi:ParB/RepB/Spo0J family partition protein